MNQPNLDFLVSQPWEGEDDDDDYDEETGELVSGLPLQSKYDNEPKKEDKKQQTPAKATKQEKPGAKKPNKIIPRNRFDNKPQSRA